MFSLVFFFICCDNESANLQSCTNATCRTSTFTQNQDFNFAENTKAATDACNMEKHKKEALRVCFPPVWSGTSRASCLPGNETKEERRRRERREESLGGLGQIASV